MFVSYLDKLPHIQEETRSKWQDMKIRMGRLIAFNIGFPETLRLPRMKKHET